MNSFILPILTWAQFNQAMFFALGTSLPFAHIDRSRNDSIHAESPFVGRRIGGDANGEIIFHTEGKGLRSQGDESGMQAKKRRFGGDDRRSRLCLRTLQARDSAEQQSGTKLERTSKSAEKECASGKGRLGAQVVHLAKGIAPDHAAPRSLKLLSKMGDPG